MSKHLPAALTVAALALLACNGAQTDGPLTAPVKRGLVVHAETTYPVFRLDSLPATLTIGQVFTVYAFEQPSLGAAFRPCDSCFIDDKFLIHHAPDTAGQLLVYVGGRQGWPTVPHLTMQAVRAGPDTIGEGKDNRELLTPVVILAGSPPPPGKFPVFRLDSVPPSIAVGQTFTVYAFAQLTSGGAFVPCDSCWINLRNTANGVAGYVGGRQGWPTTPHLTIMAKAAGVDTLQMGKNNREIQIPITVH